MVSVKHEIKIKVLSDDRVVCKFDVHEEEGEPASIVAINLTMTLVDLIAEQMGCTPRDIYEGMLYSCMLEKEIQNRMKS